MRRLAAAVIGLGLLLGCRTADPGVRLAIDDARPARLIAGLRESARVRTAFRGSARLVLDAPDLRVRRPQRMALERPGRMRLEILGLFDQVAAILVTDGRVYQLFDARSGKTEEGPVDADLLWRVARVKLEPRRAVSLLLGTPVPQPGLSPAAARAFADGSVEIEERDGEGRVRERLRFDARGRIGAISRFDGRGQLVFEGRFEDYRPLPGPDGGRQAFAFTLSLVFPKTNARMALHYESVELLEALPDSLFELPGRSGDGAGSGAA